MLTINQRIGTPSWLEDPVVTEDDPNETEAVETFRNLSTSLQEKKLNAYLIYKKWGKDLYEEKMFFLATKMYGGAVTIASSIDGFLKKDLSYINSNIALCYLKLECPYKCISMSKIAINLHVHNIKAHHHMAAALYLVYQFEDALKHISIGLKKDPQCKELLLLEEKIASNNIMKRFKKIINERLLLYNKNFFESKSENTLRDCLWFSRQSIYTLIRLDEVQNEDDFVAEANKIMKKSLSLLKFMFYKDHPFSYRELVDFHHICHVLQNKYNTSVPKEVLFEIFFWKAHCLYYMENFEEALQNCEIAKGLDEPDEDLVLLEAKILIKLKKKCKAIELIKNHSDLFTPKTVLVVLAEEILFEATFTKKQNILCDNSQNETRPDYCSSPENKVMDNQSFANEKEPFIGSIIKCEKEHTVEEISEKPQKEMVPPRKSDNFEKVSQKPQKEKAQLRRCDVCLINIVGPKSSWINHINGKRHKLSMSEKAKLTQDIQESSLPMSSNEHNVTAMSNDYMDLGTNCHIEEILGISQDQYLTEQETCLFKISESETHPENLDNKYQSGSVDILNSFHVSDSNSLDFDLSGAEDVCHSEEKFYERDSLEVTEEIHKIKKKKRKNQRSKKRQTTSNIGISPFINRSIPLEKIHTKDDLDKPMDNILSDCSSVKETCTPVETLALKPLDNFTNQRINKEENKTLSNVVALCDGSPDYTKETSITDATDYPAVNELLNCSAIEEEFQTTDTNWETVEKNKKVWQKIQGNKFIAIAVNTFFPLPSADYNVSIACSSCIQRSVECSNCSENILAVQNKATGKWIEIRERNDQEHFYGRYRLCLNQVPCFRGRICNFAHSEEEAIIWNQEKIKKFSIRNFIKMHRQKPETELEGIASIYNKFPGYLMNVCGDCYLSRKCFIGKTDNGLFCSNKIEKHNWNKSGIMIHSSDLNNVIEPIFPYAAKNRLDVCSDMKYCSKRRGLCLKPHTFLEQKIWMFFKETKCSQMDFMTKFNDLNSSTQRKKPSEIVSPDSGPPHIIRKICEKCWGKKVVSYEIPETFSCTDGHKWIYKSLFYIPKSKSLLKHLPKIIPKHDNFAICWHVGNGKSCERDNCQYAHSKEELETWAWMTKAGIRDPDLVAKRFEKGNSEVKESKEKVQTPITRKTWNKLPEVEHCKIPKEAAYYCFFCEKRFSSEKEFEMHKNTRKHMEQIEGDCRMQWNHRVPAYNNQKYQLCERHKQGLCYYSNVPDEFNCCTQAHSIEELDEWNARKQFKMKKLDFANKNNFLSSASKLLKKYEESGTKSNVMTNHIDGITIVVNGDLTFRSTIKNCCHVWTFEIYTEKVLQDVFMLKEHGMGNFSLMVQPDGKDYHYLQGALLISQNSPKVYKVYAKFQCAMFGTFSQTIIFDFGTYPVVFKTIKCETGLSSTLEKLELIRLKMHMKRWTTKTETIIACPTSCDPLLAQPLANYLTKDIDEIMSEYPIFIPLQRDIYKRKMHGLLYLEELSQTKIISGYNLKAKIEVSNIITNLSGSLQISLEGELFGKISLENMIIEGSLMLKSVKKVLLKPLKDNSSIIYEVSLCDFEDNNMKSTLGETTIVLFNSECCTKLNLKPGSNLEAEVQFQLDRESFCKMHYAIDNISHMEHLFPYIIKNTDIHCKKPISCPDLNKRQNEVVAYAFKQGVDFLPPLVVYGPFGTGKTETIAKTSLLLAKLKADAKILICTKSNLTADEYFKRYFNVISNVKFVRVYSLIRKINTVDNLVLRFCLLDSIKSKFRMPTVDDLKNCQIVVTTLETSFNLKFLNERIAFSHIFIDEAGQDLECRTIIPFMLADKYTCIVIAGDHMQMGEEVCNKEAKNQNFGYSLMERLLYHYKKLKVFGNVPQIFFNENYRNDKCILAFISSIYYSQEDSLVSKQVECPSSFNPLEFFAVLGNESLNKESASIYNLAEVEEIVNRVSYLFENWPNSWGKRDARQILVTSPYMDQIRYIRTALRNTSRSLKDVTVIRVQNVPGLEFKAVFISSVRTSAQSLSDQLGLNSSDEGFLSQLKLLNSAFSRAMFYLAVVGHPVVLCSVGNCSKIWIEFLKKCEEHQSINPPTLTMEHIKQDCCARAPINEISLQLDNDMEEHDIWEVDLKGTFKLKADEIIKQLVIEYSKEEEYGFTVTLKEGVKNEQMSITKPHSSTRISPSEKMSHVHRCRLNVKGVNIFIARPLDQLDFEIKIPSRKHCKTALDQDEVLVKIIDADIPSSKKKIFCGEVIKVLKRKVDITDKQFVCFIDEGSFDMMVPINKKIPKIKIVVSVYAKTTKRHVSIWTLHDNKIKLVTDDVFKRGDLYAKLYVVKLLKWQEDYNLPLGIVLGILRPGKDMESTMKILDLEYNLPVQLESSYLSKDTSQIDVRDDYREMLVFTIDGDYTNDIDDAIGFQAIDSNLICLSIHIADVSFYIDRGSKLDNEAKNRATSFYPPKMEPIHMLPKNLSTDICSLNEGKDRKALSIFMTLNKDGYIIDGSVSIKRTLIRSKHRLTYKEVELVLMDDITSLGRYSPELICALKKVNEISIKWRVKRLGADALEWSNDIWCMDGPNSRALIEEMMIQANKIIARFLNKHLPRCTPLRVQEPPSELDLNVWRVTFSDIVCKTSGMRRFLKTFPAVCRCGICCNCSGFSSSNDIQIPQHLWTEILNAMKTQKTVDWRSLVYDLDKLPQAAVANKYLRRLMEKAEYVCSGTEQKCHYSLNEEAYTHFTSPIRRYIDLIVHRLVVNCIENQQASYTEQEIAEICQHCTFISHVGREYDKAKDSALLNCFLRDRPLKVNATISNINEKYEIELHLMKWQKVIGSQLVIKPSHLCLNKQPDSKNNATYLFWNQRIYVNSLHPISECTSKKEMIPERQANKIAFEDWLKVLQNVENIAQKNKFCKIEISGMQQELDDGYSSKTAFHNNKFKSAVDHELASQGDLLKTSNHFCQYSLKLKPSDFMTIQISSKYHRGLLTPFVQTVSLTKLTSICIEHNDDPTACFCDQHNGVASKKSYSSIREYTNLWKSALSFECAQTAVSNGVSAIIHNIEFQWDVDCDENEICGKFLLDKEFCKSRFLVHLDEKDEPTMENKTYHVYICVQYHDLFLEMKDVDADIKNALNDDNQVDVILHCLIWGLKHVMNTSLIEFTCTVKQNSIKSLRTTLKHVSSHKTLASVEWIDQPVPMKRMMNSLELLNEECLELPSKIVLNREISLTGENFQIRWPEGSAIPNSIQQKAIEMAMASKFSLIQGPPGTGKTFVMAHIINQFYESNKNTNFKVMCCGPSNKSADVIATSLLKLNPKIELLRVCGGSRENESYPLPYFTSFVKKKVNFSDEKTDQDLKGHTLHHLIRNRDKCQFAKDILDLEARFETVIMEGKLEDYNKIKKCAEKMFMSRAKVIITTCTGCGAKKLKDFSIKQLLIDECGMCTEPESLVPIVNTEARQVVLIGDHKQLRPIVTNKTALKCGMDTSLFQRFSDKAFMLTIQYRMHKAIAEFPSNQFYDGMLRVGEERQKQPSRLDFWPGGKHMPIAFVNVGGKEESLTTSSEEGGFESKKNEAQANIAVKIALNLVHNCHVKEEDIVILSQYRSQCTEITKGLHTRNLSSISVSTVVSAQGSERKYVILSTVRSLPSDEIEKNPGRKWKALHLGFVTDPHQINVALTRAKEGLIILGNKELLSVDEMWRDLIGYYKSKGALVEISNFTLLRNYSKT